MATSSSSPAAAMFYEGDLQSGIALALRESKSVACFVMDDGEESMSWKQQYLTDTQVQKALYARTVTLCIRAGSQEAGYLSAYYPIPENPSFIVIHNGQLLLDLRTGETQQAFKAAILKTLSVTPAASAAANSIEMHPSNTQHEALRPPQAQANSTTALNNEEVDVGDAAESTRPHDLVHGQSNGSQGSVVEKLLAERRHKLEKDQQEKEAAEKEERKARLEARKQAAALEPSSAKAKQVTYAQQQRQRQTEAKLERDRILRQIEHDKAERREKEQRRKALAKLEANNEEPADEITSGSVPHTDLLLTNKQGNCALQIRLFDGSNIRQVFSANDTLRNHVRSSVDKQRSGGDLPYTFKQMLTPLPNRNLSITDEEATLQDLALPPSSTLILVPVRDYTAAYISNQGLISRGASASYNAIFTGAGVFTGALGTFLGLGQPAPPQQANARNQHNEASGFEPNAQSSASGVNVRTLQDQRDGQEPHHLYNGNQLNFQPRAEEDQGTD